MQLVSRVQNAVQRSDHALSLVVGQVQAGQDRRFAHHRGGDSSTGASLESGPEHAGKERSRQAETGTGCQKTTTGGLALMSG